MLSEVFTWCLRALDEARTPGRALVLGLNGPQGAGKSTLARRLVERFAEGGRRAVAVSIDDFYLTNAAQRALAAANPDNRYLQQRGYPGTHDVALGVETLRALRDLQRGETMRVPVYDKSAFSGRGDRMPETAWRIVEGPLDVVILEGWMLGFRPVAASDPRLAADPALRAVNDRLASYAAWDDFLDATIQLKMAKADQVVFWRVGAEEAMKRAGRPGMTTAEARAYVETFLPAYALYTAGLERQPPTPERHLVITLGLDRNPV